jgi:hypothetical protein
MRHSENIFSFIEANSGDYLTKMNGKMGRCGAFAVGILSAAQAPSPAGGAPEL